MGRVCSVAEGCKVISCRKDASGLEWGSLYKHVAINASQLKGIYEHC